jgi:hypothetical protein
MALTYDGTGGLFTRLGRLGGLLTRLHTIQSGLETGIGLIDAEYDSERELPTDLLRSTADLQEASSSTTWDAIRSLAEATLLRAIFRERPDRSRTLEQALRFLIDSMVADAETIKTCDVNVTVTAGSGNVGNGTAGVEFIYTGAVERQNISPGTAELVCERLGEFTYYDNPATPQPWSFRWPQGSSSTAVIVVGPNGSPLAFADVYPQGPRFRVTQGSTAFAVGDRFAISATNDHGGATNGQTFQRLFDRLFDLRGLGLQLPTAGSPTIADSLIA